MTREEFTAFSEVILDLAKAAADSKERTDAALARMTDRLNQIDRRLDVIQRRQVTEAKE